jgi:hypothetical protein
MAVVATLEPGRPAEQVRAAIEQAAPGRAQRRRLAEHLAVPDTLTSESSTAPPVVQRLAHALVALGAIQVQPPRCARCGKTNPIAARAIRDTGTPVCKACWRRDPATARRCEHCGRLGLVATRRPRTLCARCYHRPVETCDGCGLRAPIVSHRGGRTLCGACDAPPAGSCGRCGQHTAIAQPAAFGQPALCAACLPVAVCHRCGLERPCYSDTRGKPACTRCGPRRKVCAHCQEQRPVKAYWPNGPVCARCYASALARTELCPACGQQRRLVSRPDGVRACSRCTPAPPAAPTPAPGALGAACQACGAEDLLYQRGRCARCVLTERIGALLRGADGQIPARLEPVYQAIISIPRPRTGLTWLQRSRGPSLLADLAAGTVPLTHEALDQLGRGQTVDHLRQMLVAHGVLPKRDEDLARLGLWLARLLERIQPTADRKLVRSYATWGVLRPLRQRADSAETTPFAARWARCRIRAAVRFLAWLHQRGTTLDAIGQADVDQWLTDTDPTRASLHDFIGWACRRRLAPEVELPTRTGSFAERFASHETLWTLARRLLHDDTLEIAYRVAGCLVLFYAQPLTRIVRLTVQDVSQNGHNRPDVRIRFGRDPVLLPQPLGALVLKLVADRRGSAGIGAPTATTWLFPGRRPGRPITMERLADHLHRLGLELRPARNTALLALAAEVPTVVLADLLNLHPHTANRWVRAAGGDWTSYAAIKARELAASAPAPPAQGPTPTQQETGRSGGAV